MVDRFSYGCFEMFSGVVDAVSTAGEAGSFDINMGEGGHHVGSARPGYPPCGGDEVYVSNLVPEPWIRSLFEGDQCVLATPQPRLALLDEAADKGAIFVQRRPVPLDVLLERERKRLTAVQLAKEERERAQHEAPERVVEVRRADGHEWLYGGGEASPSRWQRGHQYAVRLASPSPCERIGPPQHGQGLPARR